MSDDFLPVADFNDRMYDIYTAIPGIITAFDEDTKLASVQIAIRMKTVVNGVVKYLDPPPVTNVPVVLPSSTGAGVFITVPIKINDPCLLIFSQRGIDNVVERAGLQDPPDTTSKMMSRIRHHDMADAICIPGLLCKYNAPSDWALDGIEIRNASKSVCLSVKEDKIYVTGDMNVSGTVTAVGDVVAGTVSLRNHTHPYSGGDTGAPNE